MTRGIVSRLARAVLRSGPALQAWSLAALGLLAGCSSSGGGSAAELRRAAWSGVPPEAPRARPRAAELLADGGAVDPARWGLDDVLPRIAAANPTLAVARAHLDEARAARREAGAAYLPELSLGLDYVATDDPALAFGLLLDQRALSLGPGFDAAPGTTTNWRESVRLDWALFAPGRAPARAAAREGEEAARLAAEAAERRLLNAGVQAWLGLGAARAAEEVADDAVAVVERRLEETRVRAREGAALSADVLRLEVRLAAARQDAAAARLRVRAAESALNRLMDRAPDAPLALAGGEVAVGAELPEELDRLLVLAEEGRLDLLAAAHGARMAGALRDAAAAERLPWLRLFASYAFDGEDPGFDGDLDWTTLGVGLSLPLSARTPARVRRADARALAAREELRAAARGVAAEVRDASEGRRVAREVLALAQAAAGAADEAYRIVAAAQDQGAATVTDVLEAEDARKEARLRLAAARAGVQIAAARLVAAVGGVR